MFPGKERAQAGQENSMRYDTLFFDIGNTLFFYNYEFLKGLLEDRFGLTLNVAQMEEAHRRTVEAVLKDPKVKTHEQRWKSTYERWFSQLGIDEELIPEAITAVSEHPFPHLFWARMEEGTRDMLDWFRERGCRLGVISNAEGQIQRLLEHAGLDSRFEVVVDSAVVGMAKPETRIFRYAIDQLGADPKRSIYVGDLYDVDVVGARTAGLTPILIDRAGRNKDADCLRVESALSLPQLSIFSEKI